MKTPETFVHLHVVNRNDVHNLGSNLTGKIYSSFNRADKAAKTLNKKGVIYRVYHPAWMHTDGKPHYYYMILSNN